MWRSDCCSKHKQLDGFSYIKEKQAVSTGTSLSEQAASYASESDAARATSAPSTQAGDSTTESSAKQLSTQKRPCKADYSETIAEFKDYITKLHRRIDAQPSAGHGGSRSQKVSTLDLMQLFANIVETIQHRVTTDLEDGNRRLREQIAAHNERYISRGGDLGIPEATPFRDWDKILNKPHDYINKAVFTCMSGGAQWAMSNTWDAIWQMLPEDIGGILAPLRYPIFGDLPSDTHHFRCCDSIVWDFDHHTLDFLGDDHIQKCVAHLHKSINTSENLRLVQEADRVAHAAYDVHSVRAYAVSALMRRNQPFELERAKKIDALVRTIHDYLRPLGIIDGSSVEDYLRDAINCAATAGLTFVRDTGYPLPRRTGCQPGDNFDPRLMIAEGIRPGSAEESRLVEAGARVAIILSPPFLEMRLYKTYRFPLPNVETTNDEELGTSTQIIRKGNVVCYTMKEGKNDGKSVEFPRMEEEEV
ncbi:hypothetical protein L211DRAFT_871870 [Terfezia boudieri ATCC MYA-4762]|uniref:Uncharacterized protein n=1 Tax=Terfezia boudieri ATCC MYA-4762 TaxID=1051890 RepID=A0A3N4L9V6_9PEZI|nr:hypothetical protein L211DRAFT_871870 [Terfezia boudieri ATCC MYA-4762]